jgi:hypothetical protein
VRWVLFPNVAQEDAGLLKDWIRDGGILVLAVDSPEFARNLGLEFDVQTLETDPEEEAALLEGVSFLRGGLTRVDWPGQQGRAWVKAADEPFVTIYQSGRGEIWLLNRPDFLTNRRLGWADNGVLLCRLVEEVLRRRPGQLAFDEYFHGLRERPGVTLLLLQPPTLWITLQGLLLTALLLWHFSPRFGTLRRAASPRRRSKEEFLEAMASLLERKGDYADAYRTARNDLLRAMERDLGLPAATELDQVIQESARRRPVRQEKLRRVLTGASLPPGAGPTAFLKAMNELETTRDEFFHRRPNR